MSDDKQDVIQLRIDGLGALLRRQCEQPPLCAVILCSGHPRTCDASTPLLAAVDDALGSAKVPVLRFDYAGVGLSRSSPSRQSSALRYSLAPCIEDARKVVAWTRRHVAPNVIICGYSWGSLVAQELAERGDVEAYISISPGCGLHLFNQGSVDAQAVRAATDGQSALRCKTLYVVGDRDNASPLEMLLTLISARKDGGEGVSIEIIKKATHDVRGHEKEISSVVSDWLLRLQEELLAVRGDIEDDLSNFIEEEEAQVMFDMQGEILGVIDVDYAIRGGCSARMCTCFTPPSGELARGLLTVCLRCGGKHTDHEDKGSTDTAQDYAPVRVTCRNATHPKSVSKVFHVSLPVGADVAALRQALGTGLPASVQVLADRAGYGQMPLKDLEVAPEGVQLSEYVGAVTPDMIMTKSQIKEHLLPRITQALRAPSTHRQLDELVQQAGGANNSRYRTQLHIFLRDEVYAAILKDLGLGKAVSEHGIVEAAVSHYAETDLELLEAWLVCETLTRSTTQIAKAKEKITALHAVA